MVFLVLVFASLAYCRAVHSVVDVFANLVAFGTQSRVAFVDQGAVVSQIVSVKAKLVFVAIGKQGDMPDAYSLT